MTVMPLCYLCLFFSTLTLIPRPDRLAYQLFSTVYCVRSLFGCELTLLFPYLPGRRVRPTVTAIE